MRPGFSAVLLLGFLFGSHDDKISPPLARVIPKILQEHGSVRIDNYYWLRERENPEVLAYLKAENVYTGAMMRRTSGLQAKLVGEFRARIPQSKMSAAEKYDDGYYYYTRFVDGNEYPIYCRRKGSPATHEEVVLDVNQVALGQAFCSVGAPLISPDGNVAAYAVDTAGRGSYALHFKNLQTGEQLPDVISDVTDNLVWANDSRTVFYVKQHATTLREYRVYRHALQTDLGGDALVYEEKDDSFICTLFKSKSKKYIFLLSAQTLTTEYRYLDADHPFGAWKVIARRQKGHEYNVDHWRGHFYIRTNLLAENFRLMKASVVQPSPVQWKELTPKRADVFLEDFKVIRRGLVAEERSAGLTRLHVIPWLGEQEHYVDLAGTDYVAYSTSCDATGNEDLCFAYSSLATPESVYGYNIATRAKRILRRDQVSGGFDSANYDVERIYASARDGVRIPISLVHRKGLGKNTERPLLLEGYGAYGASMDAEFNPFIFSLLDRGFVYAIAHVRGGGELGPRWYEDGKLLHKKNSFTDFIACAEHLVQQKYADRHRLFAKGASAGGLLMGAVINMRPDLFRGVVAEVPAVDLLTSSLDDQIPLVTTEYDEWGNPADKQYYDYILSYSPYDQIRPQRYPNLLVTASLHDSRVQYWEPAKWVAKLQAMNAGQSRVLLKTEIEGGHDGASGRYEEYKSTAFQYAFLLDLANIAE